MSTSDRSETPRRGRLPLRYGLMIPTALFALAETTPNTLTSDILHVGGGLVAAFTALGAAGLFLFRGFWAKNVEPLILNVVTTWWANGDQMKARDADTIKTLTSWYASGEQIKARDADLIKTVSAWHSSATMQDEREQHIVRVIDSQIRRDDGLIHREIRNKVDDANKPIYDMLDELKRASMTRDDEDRRFRQEVLTQLAQITGAMSVTGVPSFHASRPHVVPSAPAVPPPPPGLHHKKP